MRATVRGQAQSPENTQPVRVSRSKTGTQSTEHFYCQSRDLPSTLSFYGLRVWNSGPVVSYHPLLKEGPKLKFIRKTRLTSYKTVS